MRHLVGVELTRLRWRRAVLLLVVAALVVPGVIWAASAWNTRPVSDAELVRAERMVERESDRHVFQRELQQCIDHPGRFGARGDDVAAACENLVLPTVDWYITRTQLDLDRERTGSGLAVVTVLAVLLLLIGTTFTGHDWNTGSMSNQLLFEPRRARVWAAKGVVVLLAGAVLASVVLTAYWTGLWLLAESRGLDPAGSVVADGYQQAARGTVFAACCGLGGYSLTMLFRSTVATLGVLFAVSLVGPLLLALLAFPGFERWMPQNNIAAFVLDGVTYWPQNASTEQTLTLASGAVYLLGLLLAVTVPSLASFGSRDVP